jgi:EmrB/QacA subfamily drug resistance transporter
MITDDQRTTRIAGTSPIETTPDHPDGALSKRQIYLVFAGVMAGLALSALDGTIVTTALATIVGDLGGIEYYAWVGTAYMLTSTTATPLFGKLSDLYGRRLLFQIAIVTFVLGSLMCGVSQNMWQLVVSRGVQGIGGGGLFSLAFAIIGDVVPPRERGKYVGFITSIFTASSVLGPLIGGFIVDNTSWRWIFLVNLPVGLVALFITDRALRLPFHRQQRRIDYLGATLLVVAVTSLLLGLSWTGDSYGWASMPTLTLFALTIVSTAAFVIWERRAEEPIIPLAMLRLDVVSSVVPMMFLVGAIIFGANTFMPLYLQGVTGVSATNSGLLLAPLAVAVAVTAMITGRITARTGKYKLWLPMGAVFAICGLTMVSFLGTTRGYLYIAMIGSFWIGAGMGALMPTGTLAVQNAVPMHEMGSASSTVIFMRQLGGAIGLAAYGTLLNSRLAGRVDPELIRVPREIKNLPSPAREDALAGLTDAINVVFRASLPVMAVAFVIALFVPGLPLRGATALTATPRADDESETSPHVGHAMPPGTIH